MLWVYYVGHGVMCNTNYILLNERINKDRYFDLEAVVYNETNNKKNIAAVMVFESSRSPITLKEWTYTNKNYQTKKEIEMKRKNLN